jgi:hypothetical protein
LLAPYRSMRICSSLTPRTARRAAPPFPEMIYGNHSMRFNDSRRRRPLEVSSLDFDFATILLLPGKPTWNFNSPPNACDRTILFVSPVTVMRPPGTFPRKNISPRALAISLTGAGLNREAKHVCCGPSSRRLPGKIRLEPGSRRLVA